MIGTATMERMSVAPMLDVTTREFRFLLGLLSRHTTLYTEMVPVGAILHGRAQEILAFDEDRPPVLQLGGSDAVAMQEAAARAMESGYNTININAGCPSPKVQSGAFGVCLMQNPQNTARMVSAIKSLGLTVTVKHRLGVDRFDWSALLGFVSALVDAGVDGLVVHARIALTGGISPHKNRTVPPLDYQAVFRLKEHFPGLPLVLNGGLQTPQQMNLALQRLDGAMVGRAVAACPLFVAGWDQTYYNKSGPHWSYRDLLAQFGLYLKKRHQAGRPVGILVRAAMDLFFGRPGARNYRRFLSEPGLPFPRRWERATASLPEWLLNEDILVRKSTDLIPY